MKYLSVARELEVLWEKYCEAEGLSPLPFAFASPGFRGMSTQVFAFPVQKVILNDFCDYLNRGNILKASLSGGIFISRVQFLGKPWNALTVTQTPYVVRSGDSQ